MKEKKCFVVSKRLVKVKENFCFVLKGDSYFPNKKTSETKQALAAYFVLNIDRDALNQLFNLLPTM